MTMTVNVDDVRIDRVIEMEGPMFDPFEFFPTLERDALEANRAWLEADGAIDRASGHIVLCVQSWLIRTPHHTILIDSCVGNHKDRPTRRQWHMRDDTAYMDALAASGLGVDDIDFVMCTHLHPDHVGWNTRLENGRWVPTFPKARYVFSEKEFRHWEARHGEQEIGYMADSVLPIVEAGRSELVRNDHALDDRVRLLPTPGHTPDHVAVRIGREGARPGAVVTGDLIHSPLQCRMPDLSPRPDVDKAQSARTRRTFLESCAESGELVCTAHFPSPSMGHVERAGEAFRFRFAGRD